jgi:quercetin dioxygenase-like cupin family protein
MKIVTLSEASKVPINHEGYFMHSSPALEIIHLCLQPGQDIPQHANPFEVVACLIKGEVILNMGEKKIISLALYDMKEVEKKHGTRIR